MKYILIFISLTAFNLALAGQTTLTVNVKEVGAEIQQEMYGVFFEDINFGADGGLYAELIKNRSFEFEHPFVGWTPFGDVKVLSDNPCFDKNPSYVRLTGKGLRTGTGLENDGFRGIGCKERYNYRFSFYARSFEGNELTFKIELISSQNDIIGKVDMSISGKDWKKYTTVMSPGITDPKCKIRITLQTNGIADIDHISLFPSDTWKGRENGLRKDLVQTLYDLHPGVFRFPGGCIVEGNTIESRYQWKNSVGPVENRPTNSNRWNYTFKHKLFPDYYQSYGLGFYEYFLLSEDIGAEPLPVLSCGLACQYESTECVALEHLQPYIQDALDLIEFANGTTNSKWGKLRAEMGHPAPFNLKMIAIGNEQWGEVYVERLKKFTEALRREYPEIKIIGSSGPLPDGEKFDYLWPEMKNLNVDMVDEHYYRSPEWFFKNADRYDDYDRNGPKVFAGEYASHPKSKENNFEAALSEAAFMTGLERNADIVHMATYAPLFAHVDAWQWRPDMIWFDNLKSVCTPSYYVQQLYACNAGTHVLSVTSEGEALKGENGLYASAVLDKVSSEIIVKVVNSNNENMLVNINFEDLNNKNINRAELTYLESKNLNVSNTLEEPLVIVPQHTTITGNNSFSLNLGCYSFYVCRIKMQ